MIVSNINNLTQSFLCEITCRGHNQCFSFKIANLLNNENFVSNGPMCFTPSQSLQTKRKKHRIVTLTTESSFAHLAFGRTCHCIDCTSGNLSADACVLPVGVTWAPNTSVHCPEDESLKHNSSYKKLIQEDIYTTIHYWYDTWLWMVKLARSLHRFMGALCQPENSSIHGNSSHIFINIYISWEDCDWQAIDYPQVKRAFLNHT